MLVLATLGVYLGLLMAGATPVFGHAATSRNFEISDEIEAHDDIDRNPDDERAPLTDSVGNYFSDLEYFLWSLNRLNAAGRFDLAHDNFEVSQSTELPCVKDNIAGSYTAETFITANDLLRPTLERFSKQFTDGYSLGDCLASDRFPSVETHHSRFVCKLDSKALSLEVTAVKRSPADAKKFLAGLSDARRTVVAASKGPVITTLSSATDITQKQDKILVVTRLARGSLPDLLAGALK